MCIFFNSKRYYRRRKCGDFQTWNPNRLLCRRSFRRDTVEKLNPLLLFKEVKKRAWIFFFFLDFRDKRLNWRVEGDIGCRLSKPPPLMHRNNTQQTDVLPPHLTTAFVGILATVCCNTQKINNNKKENKNIDLRSITSSSWHSVSPKKP